MLKSMTGFGRYKAVYGTREISAEIKSINHRYLDLTVKVPKLFSFLEETVKKDVTAAASRGKIEVYIAITDSQDSGASVTLNESLIEGYMKALGRISERFFDGEKPKVTPLDLIRLPEVITLGKDVADPDEIIAQVRETLKSALDEFTKMRSDEGERLCADLLERGKTISGMVDFVEARSPETVEEYRDKLKARMEELLGKGEYTDQRILAEAAIMADKVSVTEEIVRLRSHLKQLEVFLSGSEPTGRKLDFLIQEINRETNTIGSKANDYEIAKTVVSMKAEIEKIREQIQNLE